jgi:hypothetical protein
VTQLHFFFFGYKNRRPKFPLSSGWYSLNFTPNITFALIAELSSYFLHFFIEQWFKSNFPLHSFLPLLLSHPLSLYPCPQMVPVVVTPPRMQAPHMQAITILALPPQANPLTIIKENNHKTLSLTSSRIMTITVIQREEKNL